MTIRTLLIATTATFLVGACAAQDDVSSASEALGPGERCTTVICSANKVRLRGDAWFHELNTEGANDDPFPVTFISFKKGTQDVAVVGGELWKAPLPRQPRGPGGRGTLIAGSELGRARLTVEEDGRRYMLVFTGDHQRVPLATSRNGVIRYADYYEIRVKDEATGELRDLCKPANASNPTGDVNPRYAMLFSGDRFDFERRVVSRTSIDSPWFTIACAGTPMALMYEAEVLSASEPPGVHTPADERNEMFDALMD